MQKEEACKFFQQKKESFSDQDMKSKTICMKRANKICSRFVFINLINSVMMQKEYHAFHMKHIKGITAFSR